MEITNPIPMIPAVLKPNTPRAGKPKRKGPILALRIKEDPMIKAAMIKEKESRFEERSN